MDDDDDDDDDDDEDEDDEDDDDDEDEEDDGVDPLAPEPSPVTLPSCPALRAPQHSLRGTIGRPERLPWCNQPVA